MAESEMNIDSKDQKAMPTDYTKLEQAARALLAHWDTPAWKYLKSTGDLMADLRNALAEPELNLNCKSVQKRLATVWGYVKAEQAEQEPVAFSRFLSDVTTAAGLIRHGKQCKALADRLSDYVIKYMTTTAPVRTKDLTDDEIDSVMWIGGLTEKNIRKFARAVIAAYKEKNK